MDFKEELDEEKSLDRIDMATGKRISLWGLEALGCAILVALIWWACSNP